MFERSTTTNDFLCKTRLSRAEPPRHGRSTSAATQTKTWSSVVSSATTAKPPLPPSRSRTSSHRASKAPPPPSGVHWTVYGDVSSPRLRVKAGLRFRDALRKYDASSSPAACVDAYDGRRRVRTRAQWDKLWKEWGNFAHATQWMFCDTVSFRVAWKKAHTLCQMSLQARRVKDWIYSQVRRGDVEHAGFTATMANFVKRTAAVCAGTSSPAQTTQLVKDVAAVKNCVFDSKLHFHSSVPGQKAKGRNKFRSS